MVGVVGGSWYTIPEISKNSGIPESTLRRWAKWSRHLLDHKKIKNRRYYSKETTDIFFKIRELYDQGKTKDDILTILEADTPQTLEATPVYQVDTTQHATMDITRFESLIERNATALNATAHAMQMIGDQSRKISELETKITDLKKFILKMDQKNERDRMELMQEINAMMLEMIKTQKGNK